MRSTYSDKLREVLSHKSQLDAEIDSLLSRLASASSRHLVDQIADETSHLHYKLLQITLDPPLDDTERRVQVSMAFREFSSSIEKILDTLRTPTINRLLQFWETRKGLDSLTESITEWHEPQSINLNPPLRAFDSFVHTKLKEVKHKLNWFICKSTGLKEKVTSLKKLCSQVQKLKVANEGLVDSLQVSTHRVLDLEKYNEALKEEIKAQEKSIAILRQFQHTAAGSETLEEEMVALKLVHAKAQTTKDKQIIELQAEVTRLQLAYQSIRKEVTLLKDSSPDSLPLSNENIELRFSLDQLELTHKDLEQKYELLKQKLKAAKAKEQEAVKEQQTLRHSEASEVRRLQQTNKKLKEDNAFLCQELTKLENSLRYYVEEVAQLTHSLHSQQQRHSGDRAKELTASLSHVLGHLKPQPTQPLTRLVEQALQTLNKQTQALITHFEHLAKKTDRFCQLLAAKAARVCESERTQLEAKIEALERTKKDSVDLLDKIKAVLGVRSSAEILITLSKPMQSRIPAPHQARKRPNA